MCLGHKWFLFMQVTLAWSVVDGELSIMRWDSRVANLAILQSLGIAADVCFCRLHLGEN